MDLTSAEAGPATGAAVRAPGAGALRGPLLRASVLALAALALFLAGRALAPHTIDFGVYHQAARSLLAGRTDLYSTSFALEPPMRYVYPPLFVVLVAPLGLLEFDEAFGIWFTVLVLATFVSLRYAIAAWWPRQGWGRGGWMLALSALFIAGPALVYGLRSANVHLLLVLMLLVATVAWGRGHTGRAAALIAAAGAIKIFPLFLVPVLLVLKEWRMVARITVLSAAFWMLPLFWFGPAGAVSLYHQWRSDVAGNVERLRRESRLDVSLESAAERWLSEVDYARRIDSRYPQANLARLGTSSARAVGKVLVFAVVMASLLVVLRLGRSMADPMSRAAAAGGIFATAQLLIGPYTTLLYLSAWILPVLGLPGAARVQLSAHPRLAAAFGLLGAINLVLVFVPGSASHRMLEAWGAHTLMSAALWALAMWIAWRFPRRRALPAS
jgi:hypothetical protein